MSISGWFESEYGAVLVDYEYVSDSEDLASRLYKAFGADCWGVDLELEGEYIDGTDMSTTMTQMLEDLEFLCST